MATAQQQVIASGGPRPTPPQGPPPGGMVLPHGVNQQPHLVQVPMMQNPAAPAQFTPGPNFPHHVPSHPAPRPMLNGLPHSTHQTFSTPNQIAAMRQAQLRQLHNSGVAPGVMGPMQYQSPM